MNELVGVSVPLEGVTRVQLQRAEKKNALSIALRDAVSDVFDHIRNDNSTRVVIITGAGSVFSAGFDLAEFSVDDADHQRRLWDSSDRFHHAVLRCPVPVIAAVNGPALAGGFDLAVLADLRVAAASARFAHVEHVFGDVVYRPLREIVGGGVARELVLTGRSIDAAEALRIGLVNAVVPDDELPAAALATAEQIARAPRHLLERTKAKIIAATDIPADTPTLDL